MLRRLISIFFVFYFHSLPLSAQESSSDTGQQEIEYSINVTADRLEEPLKEKSDSVTVITREQIERHQWRFVSEALRDVPGLSIVQSGSAGKTTSAFVRGAESSHVLVLVDGIPVNDPYFGGVALESLTTDNIERIEIVRGTQSPLYGSDSIGGVIQIFTREGENGIHAQARIEGGALETIRENAGVSGASDRFRYSMNFARHDSSGQFANDELHQNTFSAKGSYQLRSSTQLSIITRINDAQIGIPFNSSFEPALDRNQESTLSVFGTSLTHSTGRYLNMQAHLNFTHVDFLFEDPEDVFSFSQHDSNIFQLNLQNDLQLGASDVLSAGIEVEKQTLDAADQSGELQDLSAFDQNIYSFFLQNKYQTQKWIVTAGFRYDHHDTFGDTINPRVSLAYLPDDRWKIRAAAATGFRAPSAGDLYYPFYGNPDLHPEKSRSWEIGFDYFFSGSNWLSGTWFHNKYKDLITFDPNTFVAGNVARAKAQGLELASNISIERWIFSATYTFLNSEDEIENHQLVRRPEHSASLRIAYEQQRWGSAFRLLGIGERLETDFRVFPTVNVFNAGYVRADLSGFLKLSEDLELFARIENLFDGDYEEVLHFPVSGIAFFAGIAFSR